MRIFLLFLSLFISCGPEIKLRTGEEEEKAPPKPQITVPTLPASVAEEQKEKINTKFLLISPYFQTYLSKPLQGKVDIFKSNLAKFAPFMEGALEEVAKPVEEGKKSPLEYYTTDSYSLQLIMSGTPVPKALVIDPKGKTYIIEEGTRIGNNDGKVEKITQYEVVIIEKDKAPIVKTISPPFSYISEEMEAMREYK